MTSKPAGHRRSTAGERRGPKVPLRHPAEAPKRRGAPGGSAAVSDGSGGPPPARRKRERTREQIVMAAVEVIAARGVDAARLIDVARAAGVSVGNVQYYFDTREDLLAATFEAANDASVTDWEAMSFSDVDARSRLSAMLRMAAFGRPGWEDIGWTIWVEFWAVAHRNERFREQYDAIYRKWRETLVRAITDGVEHGEFKPRDDVHDSVDRLAAIIEGLAIRTILGPADMPPARMFELLSATAERELDCVLPR